MLMHQILRDGAARYPDKIALRWVDRDVVLSFSESVTAMEDYGGALHSLGVRKGDRVTLFAHNGMDYLLGLFACWRIGAIAALVNVRLVDELDYYLADHTPSVVIYTHDMGEKVRAATARASSIKHIVCMDGPQDGALSLPELLAAKLPAPPDPADEDAIAHLSYTSGTTGKPKGACLAHEPTTRACACIAERLRLTPDDVSFGPTALSSSYQLVGNLLPPLIRIATVNVMGKWTPSTGFDALEWTGASLFVANPSLLNEVLIEARVRGHAPARLRVGLSGGGPVPSTLKAAWRDELNLPLAESYGQSELGGFFGLGEPMLQSDTRLGAVGRPLPDKEVRILDAKGCEMPAGQIGEVCMRGGFMHGYWDKPEKTAETLRGGWLHSGDAGIIDRDGYLTMRGRFAELIEVGGQVWFPRDVEEALCAQGGVKESAVIAVPDASLGQRPIGYVTLANDEVDLTRLKEDIAARLPYDLAPLMLIGIAAFPMTPTGKIAKAKLRDRARTDM